MRTRSALQLCVWLAAGLCLALREDGPAPDAQAAVLTEGLLHLLSGVEESGRLVERQARRARQELRAQARELSLLRGRAERADRLWAGLRRELQVGAAREEGLLRGAEELRGLIGWDALERRLTRVEEIVQAVTTPGAVKAVTLNISLLQAEIEAQDRRLSDLSLELMIQDGLVAQQDQRITELQASETREDPEGFL